jgi:hypothetical protein
LLSVAGVSVGLSELQHVLLLAAAVAVSVGVSAWRSWQTKRRWPVGIALTGAALVLAGHLGGELHLLEWAGVFTLLVGGLSEHLRLRTQAVVPASAPRA